MTDPNLPDRQWQLHMPPGQPPTPAQQHRRRTGNRRRWLWLLLGVLVLAGLVVGGFALFSGGSATDVSPRGIGRQLFAAAKNDDTSGVRRLFCAGDVSSGRAAALLATERVTSYRITTVEQSHGRALVSAQLQTSAGRQIAALPLVARNGAWKVCFTDAHRLLTPSATPTPSGTPTATTSSPCDFATTAKDAATVYVGLAESGETDQAQTCVLGSAVSSEVTASIQPAGTANTGLYAPAGQTGTTFEFVSVDHAHHLSVTIGRAGGKFRVTGVTRS